MDEHMHDRTALLLGDKSIRRLNAVKVAVIGLGGVGGIAAEALVRAGVGRIVLVDSDRVALSNLNRQIVALHSTIGRLKVDVMRDRLLDINPALSVEVHPVFVSPEGSGGLIRGCDHVIDAIDYSAVQSGPYPEMPPGEGIPFSAVWVPATGGIPPDLKSGPVRFIGLSALPRDASPAPPGRG
jgi:hypothetical protein